jgi:hypothetical protein
VSALDQLQAPELHKILDTNVVGASAKRGERFGDSGRDFAVVGAVEHDVEDLYHKVSGRRDFSVFRHRALFNRFAVAIARELNCS